MEIYSRFVEKGHEVSCVIYSKDVRGVVKDYWRGIEIIYFPRRFRVFSRLSMNRFIRKFVEERCVDIVKVRNDLVGALTLFSGLKRSSKEPRLVFQYTWPVHVAGDGSAFWKRVLGRVLDMADLVLPISSFLGDYLVKLFSLNPDKVFPLPSGVNLSLFNPGRYGGVPHGFPNSKRYVVYVGRVDGIRRLDIVLDSLRILLRRGVDVGVVFVGGGDDVERLRRLSEDVGEKVSFTGLVNYERVPEYVAAADVCLSLLPPTPLLVFSSPIKLFEYMAMEKPVVANREIPEHREVLEESGGGLLAGYDAAEVAEALENILTNPAMREERGRRGREWVTRNRNYDKLASELERRYEVLLRG